MNAVVPMLGGPVRSLVEERAMRPPVIGRIRPGIKVLTSKARANQEAVRLYETMVAAGDSFETIGKAIESRCQLRNALAPKNVDYFTCRRSDFNNPDVADEILKLYGEDRGQGVRLYRFPVLFAFNDWMQNLPNEMAAWGTTGRKFFSQYGPDGIRYCKTYAKVERDPRAQRATRHFGGRDVIFRQDDAIPDGVCDPEQCPQYQSRQCNLSAHFVFAVPDIKGLGLIELPTNSIYVLQKAYAAMQTVQLARGRLTGTRFWLSKREFDITRINENGEAVRQPQMLTVLDADIDIGALLDGADEAAPAIEVAQGAAALLGTGGTVIPLHPTDGSGVVASGAAEPTTHAGDARRDEHDDLPPESLEEKRHRLQDLLQRLRVNTDARREQFRVYGHVKFGRGWTERLADVDKMIGRLTGALDAPDVLDREISEAVESFNRR